MPILNLPNYVSRKKAYTQRNRFNIIKSPNSAVCTFNSSEVDYNSIMKELYLILAVFLQVQESSSDNLINKSRILLFYG